MSGCDQMTRPFVAKLNGRTATVNHGDCRVFLRTLDEGSADLLLTSPPYFIGKEYDRSTHLVDFEDTIVEVLPLIDRVLKPGGSLCWQVGNHVKQHCVAPLDYTVARAMEKNRHFSLRNRIIWTFSHGIHARRRFSGRHETILWYTKGDDYFFDLDSVRVPQKYPGKRHYKGPKKGRFSGNPQGKNPSDYWALGAVWDIPNVKANHVEKTDHPCQFPIALARRLILALSPDGGLVLDPYLGSGSSAIAALLDGRNFVGCDISPKYVKLAKARLTALTNGTIRYREDLPVRTPVETESVAIRPPHFRAK